MYEDLEPPEFDDPCIAQTPEQKINVQIEGFSMDSFNHALVYQFRDMLTKKVERTLSKLAKEAVLPVLEETANRIITDAIHQQVQKTTEFGEPVGAPTTLFATLSEELNRYFHEKVDSDGRTRKEHYHRDQYPTRLEWMVKKYAMAELEKVAIEEIKRIGEEARTKVKEAVAELITEKLAPKIRV